MKEFDLEFEVTQKFIYTGTIKANSPEEAIKYFIENHDDISVGDEYCMLESHDNLDTVVCIGERVDYGNGFTGLKKFDNPIKLNDNGK